MTQLIPREDPSLRDIEIPVLEGVSAREVLQLFIPSDTLLSNDLFQAIIDEGRRQFFIRDLESRARHYYFNSEQAARLYEYGDACIQDVLVRFGELGAVGNYDLRCIQDPFNDLDGIDSVINNLIASESTTLTEDKRELCNKVGIIFRNNYFYGPEHFYTALVDRLNPDLIDQGSVSIHSRQSMIEGVAKLIGLTIREKKSSIKEPSKLTWRNILKFRQEKEVEPATLTEETIDPPITIEEITLLIDSFIEHYVSCHIKDNFISRLDAHIFRKLQYIADSLMQDEKVKESLGTRILLDPFQKEVADSIFNKLLDMEPNKTERFQVNYYDSPQGRIVEVWVNGHEILTYTDITRMATQEPTARIYPASIIGYGTSPEVRKVLIERIGQDGLDLINLLFDNAQRM